MKKSGPIYDLIPLEGSESIRQLFVSEGQEGEPDIVKAIEYAKINELFENKIIFNLGFGDYDFEAEEIFDLTTASNNDAYTIFNTVLSTIPKFFEDHPEKGLLVSGSDSRPEFEIECRKTCEKKCCTKICRKKGQRVRIYCSYVALNLNELSIDYQFFGGIDNDDYWFDFEEFKRDKTYDSVIVFKK
jgi:hypothetical protein